MAESPVLRLFKFDDEGVTSIVDNAIRKFVAPVMASTPGLFAFYAGRRGAGRGTERVLVSVWESQDFLARAIDMADPDQARLGVEFDLGKGEIETHPVGVCLVNEREVGSETAILRVFRGRVRPGEMAAYLEEARAGALRDIAGGQGPLAFFIAVSGEDTFITTSAWTGWDRIQAATGGNTSNPIATQNTARLAGGSVHHYELVPHSIGGLLRTGAAAVPTQAVIRGSIADLLERPSTAD